MMGSQGLRIRVTGVMVKGEVGDRQTSLYGVGLGPGGKGNIRDQTSGEMAM